MGIKLEDAKAHQADIERAADLLNRQMQAATLAGLICTIEVLPFQHIGGRIFETVRVEVKVNPSDLEI